MDLNLVCETEEERNNSGEKCKETTQRADESLSPQDSY